MDCIGRSSLNMYLPYHYVKVVFLVLGAAFSVCLSRADLGLDLEPPHSGKVIELDAVEVSEDGNITVPASNPMQRAYGNRFTEMVYEAATYTTRQSAG